MEVGMTLFEKRVQALFLRVRDASLVEKGDELVFGDFLHEFVYWLESAVNHRRAVVCTMKL